jgi:hypothetical protein
MLTNCNTCQFCTRQHHHLSDVGCAVNPGYWTLWNLLQRQTEPTTLNTLPIDDCREFRELQELQPHMLTITLTLEQWKALIATNRVPLELIKQVKEQLNLSTPNTDEPIMHPVESSNIEAIGYDRANGSLLVDFLSGSRYRYLDVSVRHFQEFLAAPSKGQYLNQQIKGFYQYELIQ